MRGRKRILLGGLAFACACDAIFLATASAALGITLYATNTTNRLIAFDSATPGTLTRNVAITGLTAGDTVSGIDCRPATGQLYITTLSSIDSSERLYTVHAVTGAATLVGGFTATSGFPGIDFDPVIDALRFVGETDENLHLNPSNAAVTIGATLAYAGAPDPNAGQNPSVNALAYTNNFVGAGSTVLYGIDTGLDILVRINAGTVQTVGPLGVSISAFAGFDIAANGTTHAALTSAATNMSALYTINLTTGAATLVGSIGSAMDAVSPISGLTAACGALPVHVASMSARRASQGVVVRWRTGTEVNTLGFNVFRERHGRRVKVNRRLIPASGAVVGARYAYVDRRASRRAGLRYWLQSVDASGSRRWERSVRVGRTAS